MKTKRGNIEGGASKQKPKKIGIHKTSLYEKPSHYLYIFELPMSVCLCMDRTRGHECLWITFSLSFFHFFHLNYVVYTCVFVCMHAPKKVISANFTRLSYLNFGYVLPLSMHFQINWPKSDLKKDETQR